MVPKAISPMGRDSRILGRQGGGESPKLDEGKIF